MITLSRLPVARNGTVYTFYKPTEPVRLLHDAHQGYGGILLRRNRTHIVHADGLLTVAYSGRRWRETVRSVPP